MPRLKAQLAALEAPSHEPRKDAHHSTVPPSQTPKQTCPRAHGRSRVARPVWVARVGAGPCLRTPTKSSWPRPQSVRRVGVPCRPTRHTRRRCMTRSSGHRSNPSSPGWNRRGDRVLTVDSPPWPRSRWGWSPAPPWGPRSPGGRRTCGRRLPSATSGCPHSWRRSTAGPSAQGPWRISSGG